MIDHTLVYQQFLIGGVVNLGPGLPGSSDGEYYLSLGVPFLTSHTNPQPLLYPTTLFNSTPTLILLLFHIVSNGYQPD